MAQFKVGQRVRVLCGVISKGREATVLEIGYNRSRLRRDGRVEGPFPVIYRIDIDGVGAMAHDGRHYSARPHELAPLTDPLAEKFIASIKALGPLEAERV